MYKVLKIVNTYDWITETLNSNVNKIIWIIIKIIIINIIDEFVVSLNNVNNKWPAIIFAVKRIDNVIGRIIFLVVSIKTIKGIKIIGVPWGIICANPRVIFFVHKNVIKLNHKGKENVKEKIKCLELVKIYGYIPIKLFIKIKVNKEIKKIEFK